MPVDDLISTLRNKGFKVWAYRGRFMRSGARCVAANVETLPDLALLGPALRPGLNIDHLATEFVAYWPEARLPAAHELIEPNAG